MSNDVRYSRIWFAALALGLALLVLLLSGAQARAEEGRVVVELQGQSFGGNRADRAVAGTDNATKQPYKFMQERFSGPVDHSDAEFTYSLSGLSRAYYSVEFSFFEPVYDPGQRIFSVYANGSAVALPGLSNLDISSKVGKNYAYQVTVGVPAPGGRMDLRFKASKAEATVSYIRLIAGGQTALEINPLETRNWSARPLRFVNGPGQDVHEVILSRFGSRFMVNPTPQLLAWKQSPLGTWTEDLSELVLAFRDAQGDIRCLPFTDRYPVFSSIDQEMTMTGVSYACQDPDLPFKAKVTIRSPFYPQDAKLSTAPFFYLDIEVENAGGSAVDGDFILAQPHKDDNTGANAPQPLGGASSGYKYRTKYTFNDESYAIRSESWFFDESVAVDDASGDFQWHYADITSTGWIWPSPAGYPLPYAHKVYTFRPKGYSGLEWGFSLGPGASERRTVVLACRDTSPVLYVRGNHRWRFWYGNAAGPNLASVDEVVDYALGAERASIEEKTSFFDGLFQEASLSPFPRAGRDLAAYAFQSFVCNAWWVYNTDTGQEWFSVWEGTPCMFHSTVDVEYNDAWFYTLFWPDRLKLILQEWILFQKSNAQGKYLSHDMGIENTVNGMAYPHDMPVEENANYILLIYGYWKATGDTAFVRSEFAHVRDYARFIFNCDTDGNGMPDINVSNTIDQGSAAVQNSRNQTYLGVKALAAYRAAAEMARAQASPDAAFISSCEQRVRLINLTLGGGAWLGDHFMVCEDYSVPAADRNAYSIYASNGLLWLLASGLDAGITSSNLERFKTDLVSAEEATARRYGSVHTSVHNENQWVSQNLWRDALGYWLGVEDWAEGQEERLQGYWDLQRYYASKKNGGFWDVCAYMDFYFLGSSEATGLGLGDAAAAASYLAQAELEAGGVRGAYSLDSAYRQSLGYYPRGTAVFSLFNALARLRLDRASGYLLYDPAQAPCRVPVFSCADWGTKRVPVLVFGADGGLQQVLNPTPLLPATIKRSQFKPISGLSATPFSCSPGTDSPREQVKVTYNAPAGSVTKALVLQGSKAVRELAPSGSSLTWDGLDSEGQPVPDGVYTLYLETASADPAVLTPPDTLEVGVNTNLPNPSATWYLAEGYTGSNVTGGEFDTWVLIQNPNDQQVYATVTFMQQGGANTERRYSLEPRSRFTIHVDDILPAAEVSTKVEATLPVVVERAVYFNGGYAGHDTIGVNSPSRRWYLAEGYTGGNFDEWVLIQNPNDTSAHVDLQFQTQDQGVVGASYDLQPRSRFTVHVDDILPDAQVSTFVQSSLPVVVERAQYLNDMRSGSCSIAARAPSYTWFFAEGYTAEGFEEWLLVQNPQNSATPIDVTFMKDDGTNVTYRYTVQARSRFTIPVDDLFPAAQVSARISAGAPVIAERAMYWKDRSDGHATLGTPCPEYAWFFAEGYTAGGFEEWLLIQNPWDLEAKVTLEYMLPGGANQTATLVAPPRTRFTVNVGEMIGATEVSLKLTSDRAVVAERAMYFRERSGGHCSTGAIE